MKRMSMGHESTTERDGAATLHVLNWTTVWN